MRNTDSLRHVRVWLCLGALLLPGLLSCAANRKSELGETEEDIVEGKKKGDLTQTLEKAEKHFEQRADRNKLDKAIDLYEQAVEMKTPELDESERKTKLAGAYERLSRLYYFESDAHVRLSDMGEDARKSKMLDLYEKGVSAAERAIVLRDSNLADAVSGGEKLRNVVGDANPDAVPALYWYATNLGKWGVMKGISTILKHKEDIFQTMKFICDEDPEFYYGGCHRYFGAYWTKVPFNKSEKKSKKHFEKSLEIADGYLATKVLMADNYAALAQKPDLYKELLNEVLEAPADEIPEIQPENKFEKQKAKRLLEKTEERFY